MRDVKRSKLFMNDLKRLYRGKYRDGIDVILNHVIANLAQDIPLEAKYHDHNLHGKWRGYRECHIKPDLLLIYQKTDDGKLVLYRMGSHSELELS